uniref:Uncharacterized protein n=1 Tax=Panagrolaimus sp. ES5 TaxID=591445 RepID=A0AC34GAJ6_9BILA
MVLPRICNYRIIYVNLRNQELTLKEYLFLIGNNQTEILSFDCKITKGDGLIVPAEELLEVSPNLIQFSL